MRSAGVLCLSAMTVIAVVSCGGDDESPAPEPPAPTPPAAEVPISFQGDLGDGQAVTRSTEIGLNTKHTAFRVWGYKDGTSGYQEVMNGYTVKWVDNSSNTTTTNTNGWEYVNQQSLGETEQSIKYWDYSATAYRFFGIAGSTATSGRYAPDDTNPTSYVVTYTADARTPDDIPLYSHLWYNGPTAYGQPVKLEFIRPVSRVRFMFTFEDPDEAQNTELTDKDFRPTNGTTIKLKGSVTVTYPLDGIAETFAATSEAEGMTAMTNDYYTSVTKDNENSPTVIIAPYRMALGDVLLKREYTVLPVTGQGTYTLTVSVNGDPKTAIVPAQYMDWKPGFEYTYIFKIHVDGSVSISSVDAAFTPWTTHEKPRTIYNW